MSETGNLKLKKHDNPSTNEEQFNINNYLNSNWDKIDENVGETNNQILQLETEKAELEKELKEMQEDYYQASVRGQASGEYIHVEDSSNCRAKIGISGNSEQETREGYNKLNTEFLILFNSNKYIGTANFATKGEVSLENNSKYSLIYKKAVNISDITLNLYDASNVLTKITTATTVNEEYTVRTFETGINISLGFYLGGNVQYSSMEDFIEKSKLMLLKGDYSNSVIPKYEQYGAMPSPDYPSEIKTVGDNVNLFDKTTTTDGARLGINGTSYLDKDYFYSDYIEVKSGQKYTLSYTPSVYTRVCYYSDKVTSSFISKNDTDKTFIVPLNAKYIRFANLITNKDIIKLTTGTEVGEYSPYGQGSVKVTKCNKNIFDKNKISTGTVINRNTGSILATSAVSNYSTSDYCMVKPLTCYHLGISYSSNNYGVVYYDKNKEYISGEKLSNYFTTPKKCKYVRFTWITTDYDVNKIQLSEGQTVKEYEQHQEQSYIMPVQKEMLEEDYFDFDNEEEVHMWEKIESYNGETITTDYISTTGQLTTGATIYYKKATPTHLKFTDEQKTVAKELNNARTYKNVTNITTDSIAVLDLDYAKDLETLLNNTQALAVSNASEGV